MATMPPPGGLLKLSVSLRSLYGARTASRGFIARHQPMDPSHALLVRSPFWVPSSERYLSSESLPYILQPSFWRSLVPKFMRRNRDAVAEAPRPKKKEWNPATFFIAIFMLIGSQAIQMISMRRDFDKFSNQTEARLATLREVVRRIQSGEDVDVEGLLGKGDRQSERDWEDVIRELEEEDARYREKRQRKSKKEMQRLKDSAANAPPDTESKA